MKNSIIKSVVIFLVLFSLFSLPAIAISPILSNVIKSTYNALLTNYTYVSLQKVMAANSSISESNLDSNAITKSLNDADPKFNKKFDISNMAPGDKMTKAYDLIVKNISDADIKLEMIKTSPNVSPYLAEKIMVNIKAKIANNDATIYDGTMNDFVKKPLIILLNKTAANTQDIIFNIGVSLPIDTGNEYQGKSFTGDFQWSIYQTSTAFNPYTSDDSNVILPCVFLIAAVCAIWGLKKVQLTDV